MVMLQHHNEQGGIDHQGAPFLPAMVSGPVCPAMVSGPVCPPATFDAPAIPIMCPPATIVTQEAPSTIYPPGAHRTHATPIPVFHHN